MKKVRNSSITVLLTALALILGVFTPGVAQATSTYDGLLHTSPTLYVYTDGATKSQKMDISQSWYNDYSQAYAARMAQNIGWPTNFMTELDAIRSSGSWGIVMRSHIAEEYTPDLLSCQFGDSGLGVL